MPTSITNPYPVNLRLEGQPCLVVGAGNVAVGKIYGLVRAGADVTAVAPEAHHDVANDPRIRWQQRAYRPGDVNGYRLVITCTDDPATNAQVFRDGERAGVLVNSADDLANCRFALPSTFNRGDVQITVSTAGRSPALSAWLRRRIEADIGPEYRDLLELLARVRDEIRASGASSEIPGWKTALEDGLLEVVTHGDHVSAERHLRMHLGLTQQEVIA